MKKVVKEYIKSNKERTKKLSKQTEAGELVAKYIQLYEKDKIDNTKFRNLCYGAKIYSEILRNYWLDEAEKRLEELEALQGSSSNEGLNFEGWPDEKIEDYIIDGANDIVAKRKKDNIAGK